MHLRADGFFSAMKGARDADGVNHTLHPERTSKKNCRLATYSVEGYEWASEENAMVLHVPTGDIFDI